MVIVRQERPIRVHSIRTFFPELAGSSGLHQFIRYLDQRKIRVADCSAPMGAENFPVRNSFVRRCLLHVIRRNGIRDYHLNDLNAEFYLLRQWWLKQFDILHYLHGEHSLQYLPGLFRRLGMLRRKPPVVAVFNHPPEIMSLSTNIKIIRELDHILVLAPDQFDYFAQYVPANKISLIPHGVDTDFYCPADSVNHDAKFKCLSVGQWLRDYATVFRVAEMLEANKNIEFHIVSGSVKAPAGLKNVFVHVGIDDNALLRMYQQAGLLFIPLLNATANNAILEGIACGLPVVTTDLTATRTYLSGKEAFFIPRNSPELFAEALLKLYRNADLRRKMSLNARKRALELSWQKISRQYEALYFKLMAEVG